MKIRTISIRQHPALGDLDVSFLDADGSAFDTVIIAGGNGTGKTTLLELILPLFHTRSHIENGLEVVISVELGDTDLETLRAVGENLPDNRRLTARITSQKRLTLPEGSYIPNTENAWLELVRNHPCFYNEARVEFNAGTPGSITNLKLDSEIEPRSGNGAATGQLLVDVKAEDDRETADWVATHPGEIPPDEVKSVRMRRFTDAFSIMFPSKKLVSAREGLALQFEEFGRRSDLNQLSTGEKQILFRATYFLKNKAKLQNSIVLIDEPELSLHPEWQERIIPFYQKILGDENGNHPQLIVATHSPFIVHGAATAKTVVLEKDKSSGAIGQMQVPVYPSARGLEAALAFNIDSFLNAAKKPLVIMTEGETDAAIILTAWRKLFPGRQMPFEIRGCLGDKNLSAVLRDDQLFRKVGERKILGIFDFDSAFNQWQGVWSKNSDIVTEDESSGLLKKHRQQSAWVMLLPVPAFRRDYASRIFKGDSLLSIEFLFEDRYLIDGLVSQKPTPMGGSIPVVEDARKAEFARHVETLGREAFDEFAKIFNVMQAILQ